MTKKLRQIKSDQIKAELFQGFYRLETAGVPLQQSLSVLLNQSPAIATNLSLVQQAISKGHTISESGYRAKLFSDVDKQIIHTGEESGSLSSVYQLLAQHYASKVRTRKDIKSKLVLPIAMLILMIFINPLPALILGSISAGDYLGQTLGTIIVLALVVYSLLNIVSVLKKIGLEKAVDQLQLSLPFISSWTIKRQVHAFFTHFGLLLKAGVSMSTALPTAINTMSNEALRSKLETVCPSVNEGNSLAVALQPITEISQTTIKQIEIGEQSGRLDQTLIHLSYLKEQDIKAETAFVAEWIPRIIYGLIVMIIAYSIISSAKISSI